MSTRSDQERDQCSDMLIARVQELEGEVLRLKEEQHDAPPAVSAPKLQPILATRPAVSSQFKRPKSAKPSSSATLENVIGIRRIGVLGVVAVIFGVSFFLKYSFDNNLIGEAGRVMPGIVGGIAFLITGEYLQKTKTSDVMRRSSVAAVWLCCICLCMQHLRSII